MLIRQVNAAALDGIYKPAASMGGTGATISTLVSPIIANTLIVSGLVAFFVILFAGFSYISGAGDKAKLTQSTQMLNYGILGLVVVVASYLITKIIGTVIGFNFF